MADAGLRQKSRWIIFRFAAAGDGCSGRNGRTLGNAEDRAWRPT